MGAAQLPCPAHVVVVVGESHCRGRIIDSLDAPYLTSLAGRGASFSASYAVAAPSVPNCLALFAFGLDEPAPPAGSDRNRL